MRKLITFLIALASIAFGVCSPAAAQSMTLLGVGRGSPSSFSVSFTAADVNNSPSTSNTFTESFGPVDSTRQIVVAVGYRNISGATLAASQVTSMTIGGVSASPAVATGGAALVLGSMEQKFGPLQYQLGPVEILLLILAVLLRD